MPVIKLLPQLPLELGLLLRRQGLNTVARLAAASTVAMVLRGSRAEQGGLKIGDLIVEINGRPILSREVVKEALADATLEHPLRLAVKREGERLVLTLAPASARTP